MKNSVMGSGYYNSTTALVLLQVGQLLSSSPLAPSIFGSSSQEGVSKSSAKITLDGKQGYSNGSSVVIEISNLNKVKEGYIEESLQVCLTSSLVC
ncbi:guanyl-nucleotide exchange factor [Actinidia rufa]|uniref:Guanyl-nucleotide exchange factor n=1 Tax=Actinidia rufa TaxID=165716 RepID=A0A7J0ERF7_9ERIC|nr:guanyl-nucleotide exchange factor [Actinidia rufa]